MFSVLAILLTLALNLGLVSSHTVITYPGWRGDNLITNGTLPQYDASALGMNYDKSDGFYTFPYGQQWIYPCGGMPLSTNRSLWPVNGGALAIQPGWFQGHSTAQIYVNIGITAEGELAPPNMSHPVVSAFQITGPSNEAYSGAFCLPQVPLVPNVTFSIGDNITIQVVELAKHGAAIYNCVDVTLADAADVPEVNSSNCFNSTDLSFQLVYETTSLTGGSVSLGLPSSLSLFLLPLIAGIFALGI